MADMRKIITATGCKYCDLLSVTKKSNKPICLASGKIIHEDVLGTNRPVWCTVPNKLSLISRCSQCNHFNSDDNWCDWEGRKIYAINNTITPAAALNCFPKCSLPEYNIENNEICLDSVMLKDVTKLVGKFVDKRFEYFEKEIKEIEKELKN